MSRFILNTITIIVTIAVSLVVIIPVYCAFKFLYEDTTTHCPDTPARYIYRIQLPTRIVPDRNGGYEIQHSDPTEFPTQVRPDGRGGFIADQLGHQPTYIHPDRSTGGYTIDAPFHNQAVPNAELDDDDDNE